MGDALYTTFFFVAILGLLSWALVWLGETIEKWTRKHD